MKPLDPLRYVKRKLFPSPPVEYFPVDAWTDSSYEDWFLANRAGAEELDGQRATEFAYRPKFSIIVPLFKTPVDFLSAMAESVFAQTYDNFELILVNASPEDVELMAAVNAITSFDQRAKQVLLDGNFGIAENTNYGIAAACGDFLCFLDHDDFIEPNILFEYVRLLNEHDDVDVLYCDEDMVRVTEGVVEHIHPLFKPSYSPELMLCKNQIIHMMTIRAEIVRSMPSPDRTFDGAQDYNMVLFATGVARRVCGVQKVLYHWRICDESTADNPNAKPYSRRASRKAAFNRISDEFPMGRIVASGIVNSHTVWFGGNVAPSLSVVVDCGDNFDGIEAFLEQLVQTVSYPGVEVVSVSSNGGSRTECPEGIRLKDCLEVQGGRFDRLNAGARVSTGDYLLFVGVDDVFLTPEPFSQLAGLCEGRGIGAVAAKCLYSDYSVMNYGIAVTPERIMPLYRGYPDEFPAYQCNTRAFQNVSAVSWRGMMVSCALFQETGGFDTRFSGEIGSADFCQKLLRKGLRIVQTPTVKIQTGEMPPEKRYDCVANSKEFTEGDMELFDLNWPGVRSGGDPFFNSNLDQSSEYFQISFREHSGGMQSETTERLKND